MSKPLPPGPSPTSGPTLTLQQAGADPGGESCVSPCSERPPCGSWGCRDPSPRPQVSPGPLSPALSASVTPGRGTPGRAWAAGQKAHCQPQPSLCPSFLGNRRHGTGADTGPEFPVSINGDAPRWAGVGRRGEEHSSETCSGPAQRNRLSPAISGTGKTRPRRCLNVTGQPGAGIQGLGTSPLLLLLPWASLYSRPLPSPRQPLSWGRRIHSSFPEPATLASPRPPDLC